MIKKFILISRPRCGRCAAIDSLLRRMSVKHKDIQYEKVDAAHADYCNCFKINSVPTVLYFEDGSFIRKINGLTTLRQLTAELQSSTT